MMRRIVDGAIPACAAVGALGPTLHLVPPPPSLTTYLGPATAWVWLLALSIGFTTITGGVVVSKQHPAAAFTLEAVPFSFIGTLFAVQVVASFHTTGSSAWAVAWWEVGIAFYCYARAVELWRALRAARYSQPSE